MIDIKDMEDHIVINSLFRNNSTAKSPALCVPSNSSQINLPSTNYRAPEGQSFANIVKIIMLITSLQGMKKCAEPGQGLALNVKDSSV